VISKLIVKARQYADGAIDGVGLLRRERGIEVDLVRPGQLVARIIQGKQDSLTTNKHEGFLARYVRSGSQHVQ
jgi:hypothetical protein